MNNIEIIGVIPARYSSQRLPAKPLIDLLGKTMIQRVYEQAKKATLLSRVVVATDDSRIEEAVRKFRGEVMMTARDIKSGSDRVAAVAAGIPGEIYVNIQGDEPLISPQMIDEAVRVVADDPHAGIGTLVKRITNPLELKNPSIVKVVIDASGYALYFSRAAIPYVRGVDDQTQWLSHGPFLKHVGIYVFRSEALKAYATMVESPLEKSEKLEQLRLLEHGFRIRVGRTEHESIPVDTPEDADLVRTLLKQKQPTN